MRKGLVHAGPSGGGGSCSASALSAAASSVVSAIATCPGLVGLSAAAIALAVLLAIVGSSAFAGLMDRCRMLSRKMLGVIGPRVDPIFASSSTSVLFALVT